MATTKYKSYLIFVLLQLAYAQAIPTLSKCSLDDSTCLTTQAGLLLQSFIDGVPELGIDKLDPMELDEISVEVDGLNYKSEKFIVKGLKNATIDSLSVNSRLNFIRVLFKTAVNVEDYYEVNGPFMSLPVIGKGVGNIQTGMIHFNVIIVYDIKKNNGKSFMHFKNFYYGVQITDKSTFDYDGLYNGDKTLSDMFNNFLNENSLIISYQFTRDYYNKMLNKVVDAAKRFMTANALEDIALY